MWSNEPLNVSYITINHPPKARENARMQVASQSSFTSDWMEMWRKFNCMSNVIGRLAGCIAGWNLGQKSLHQKSMGCNFLTLELGKLNALVILDTWQWKKYVLEKGKNYSKKEKINNGKKFEVCLLVNKQNLASLL